MKKILSFITVVALSFSFIACEGLFNNLEGDLTKMSGEDLASSEAGLTRMMAALYAKIPMGAFGTTDQSTDNAVATQGQTMGLSFNGSWDYTTMRDVNNLIKIVEEAYENGTLSENLYKTYIGEARFVRAYYYFGMVRTYGGVPIVTEPLDDKYDGGENLGLYIPRSTEKDTWDFVLAELDAAAELLPESRTDGTYRANKWSALGLKSRVALYAASVSRYWKNAQIAACQPVNEKLTYMEESYAKDYYTQCIEASEAIIKSNQFSLYNPNPSSVANAVSALTDLFLSRQDCEFIFGQSYNNGVSTSSNGFDVPNSPMQAKRTGQVWKWGCYSVSSDIVDLYDAYDANFNAVSGVIKTRKDGKETEYIPTVYTDADAAAAVEDVTEYVKYAKPVDAFADKDARFQAWVIYPGINFRGVDIVIQGGIWDGAKGLQICGTAGDYVTAGGQRYYMYGAESSDNYSAFDGRGRANDGSWYTTGFGIRKFLDPNEAVQYSTNPWYDIRYTEILLNYCEAIVERDGTDAGDAKKYLNAIRKRAYFQDEVSATLDNVLKERRLELAFEGDRSMTMHRRRDHYRVGIGKDESVTRRHALIPVCDVRSGQPQYIFVRANMFADDYDKMPSAPTVQPENYYNRIGSYAADGIVPNPSQVL